MTTISRSRVFFTACFFSLVSMACTGCGSGVVPGQAQQASATQTSSTASTSAAAPTSTTTATSSTTATPSLPATPSDPAQPTNPVQTAGTNQNSISDAVLTAANSLEAAFNDPLPSTLADQVTRLLQADQQFASVDVSTCPEDFRSQWTQALSTYSAIAKQLQQLSNLYATYPEQDPDKGGTPGDAAKQLASSLVSGLSNFSSQMIGLSATARNYNGDWMW